MFTLPLNLNGHPQSPPPRPGDRIRRKGEDFTITHAEVDAYGGSVFVCVSHDGRSDVVILGREVEIHFRA